MEIPSKDGSLLYSEARRCTNARYDDIFKRSLRRTRERGEGERGTDIDREKEVKERER